MAAKRKPGLSIPDADRHTVKRQLRLTPAESAALDAVAEARGVNASRAVGALALVACGHADPVRPMPAINLSGRSDMLTARRRTK